MWLFILSFLFSCATPGKEALVKIQVAGHTLWVEVADTPEERARGLMFRKKLPEDRGMLFIFEEEGVHGFWMLNTMIPLSIAFLREDGRIINMTTMLPGDTKTHFPVAPCRYALEANRGWFEKRGIKPGDQVIGGPMLPRGDMKKQK